MVMRCNRSVVAVSLAVFALTAAVHGDVLDSDARGPLPQCVHVGDIGNPGELSGVGAGGSGPNRVCGAVDYAYDIGQCEVTAAQYVEFLNAVAASDPYQLYDDQMANSNYGCRINRTGQPGDYTYSVPADWANRPVDFVNWGDAARYANWLTNGMPVGAQGPGTTEDGSYTLSGAMSDAELLAIDRNPGAGYVIPSEDEWYKAAYYRSAKAATDAWYWDYPTRSDDQPSNYLFAPDIGNSANFCEYGYTLGPPYYRSEVGAFENSASPYGTFDQGGNVKEWTEGVIWNNTRCVRGGSCFYGAEDLHANKRVGIAPAYADNDLGFRIALVPEPGAAFLFLTGILLCRRRS